MRIPIQHRNEIMYLERSKLRLSEGIHGTFQLNK